jgi:broad specificity phosphatase PhoE
MAQIDDPQETRARRGGRLIMVRHGQSEGNRERRFTISSETPLTELGRGQARAAAMRIARMFKPEVIISSPFARARETSAIIAAELNLEIEVVHDLHERDLGCLKGHSYDALREAVRTDPAYNPEQGWRWRPDGGESYEDVRVRVAAAIEGIRARYPEHEAVVVSHGGVMLSVWAHIAGWKGAHLPPNCGIVLVEHDRERLYHPKIIEGAREGELG